MRPLEKIRAELQVAQERLAVLESAGLLVPEVEALAAIDVFIGQCADRARDFIRKTSVAFCNRTGYRPKFVDSDVVSPHQALERAQDIVALVAGDALRAELVAAVRNVYADGAQAMTEADRQRTVEDLRVKIQKLEREEYAACVAAGLPLRAGTPAELVLGLES